MPVYEEISLDALQTGMNAALDPARAASCSRGFEANFQLALAGRAAVDTVRLMGSGQWVTDDVVTLGGEDNQQLDDAWVTPAALRVIGCVGYELYARYRSANLGSVVELCVDPTMRGDKLAAVVLADWPTWGLPRTPGISYRMQHEYAVMVGSCVRVLRAELGLDPFSLAG